MMENIKVVSFDFWNTFAIPNKEYANARTEYLRRFGVTKEDYTRTKAHLDYYAETSGMAVTPEIAISMLFPYPTMELHYPLSNFSDNLNELFAQFPPTIPDEVQESLYILAELNIPWGITSNTNFIPGRMLSQFIEYRVDSIENCCAMIFSDSVGHSKPSPIIFEKFMNTAEDSHLVSNLKKRTILHIGDNNKTDLEGAKDYGFHAELIVTPKDILNIIKELT